MNGTSGASCAITFPTACSPITTTRSPARCPPRSTARHGGETSPDAIALEHAGGPHRPLTLTVNWLATYAPRIEAQIATRDPHGPHSTGAVEQHLHELDRRLRDRAGSFTNRARMAKLLALMTLELNGQADARRWADQLRERLYLAGGRAANQRPHDDPKGSYSLIA